MGYVVTGSFLGILSGETNPAVGAGMSRAYSTETHAKGWIIPQAVQMIPAVIILVLIWFTPGM